MSASIFHGAPGSFKSASAFWFEVLPALRSGRIVVTNIEGVLTKESIEIELNEVFPKSADIWRLSSQTDTGLFLWRRWFWWMPVKAFIIIDEVQDVFPNDSKVFKPEELDNKGIDSLKSHLPEKFYNHYKVVISQFKPDLSESTQDDTGETILDENGDILYPRLMREANMRHRKYNWDIIYCTPEITEIHKLVRSVCEFAYYHKYNQALEFIPYFKRRPRTHEHSPKSTGLPRKKDDITKWKKIPLDVHKCYRSTSTGGITKRGGANGFKDPTLIFTFALLLFAVCYATWWGFIKEDRKSLQQHSIEANQENSQVSSNATVENISISRSVNSFQGNNENVVSLKLPYESSIIYMTGYQTVLLNKDRVYKEYFFSLISQQNEISLNSNDLYYFGISVEFINDCTVKLVSGDLTRLVHCSPKIIKKPISEQDSQSRSLDII
ncbi:MAG: zona occludens toxin-like protein [Colwellia sp.]